MSLLEQLNTEFKLLDSSGSSNLHLLLTETDTFLHLLQSLEANLEASLQTTLKKALDETADKTVGTTSEKSAKSEIPEISPERDITQPTTTSASLNVSEALDNYSSQWYNGSISSLKKYNGQISKFLKNVVNNSKFKANLDEAYTFPLPLDSYPQKDVPEKSYGELLDPLASLKASPHHQLMKTIALHLLKLGHGNIVRQMDSEFGLNEELDHLDFSKFVELSQISNDISKSHDLSLALQWLESKSKDPDSFKYDGVRFKFHMLQFVILLTGNRGPNGVFSSDSKLEAHIYANRNFPLFLRSFVFEVAPLLTLLLFNNSETDKAQEDLLKSLITKCLAQSDSPTHAVQRNFVHGVLEYFQDIHSNRNLFNNLASEFACQYCADMNLSNDSPLFQTLLAGFVNLPNFYKYSKVQRRLSFATRADTGNQDLPFQLPDKNQFLFNYHPIFICPVSKEQLTPLTSALRLEEERWKGPSASIQTIAMPNPVIVFNHCRHLALRESVQNLTKNGNDVFKCHYCYKKHKMLDLSVGYFIDL